MHIHGTGAAPRAARACRLSRTTAAAQPLLPRRRGRRCRGGACGTAAAIAATARPLVCGARASSLGAAQRDPPGAACHHSRYAADALVAGAAVVSRSHVQP
eukprot:scaffold19406_cov62-Phaeocystis_antarctica.AAC.2